MNGYLQILYKPKSILGLLVAAGLLFILLSGLTMPIQKDVSQFLLDWGKTFLIIGVIGWLLYILPDILKKWMNL